MAEVEAEIKAIQAAISQGRFEDAPKLPELQARLEFRKQNMLAKDVDPDSDYPTDKSASKLNSPLTFSELSP